MVSDLVYGQLHDHQVQVEPLIGSPRPSVLFDDLRLLSVPG